MDTILITGGAGFIGSHLASELLDHGYAVRALDDLSPQVHGPERRRPTYLDPRVELHVGDVGDPRAVRRALEGVDAVFHLAAAVGVGQSMYEIERYTRTNACGTAVLAEALIERPVERWVVASSMSIYGEGASVGADGARDDAERSIEQLRRGEWEPRRADGEPLEAIPTPETKPPSLASIYALSKFDQERIGLLAGAAYHIPTVALRFFNVYGPHQALSNPYTGVLAIFASRIGNGRPPLIFEDGLQRRDFVHVRDVARACRLALESPQVGGAVNVGSGRSRSVREIAERVAAVIGRSDLEPEITGRYRVGDVRHCFADVSRARDELGFEARVDFDEGLEELAEWLREQSPGDRVDHVDRARSELEQRGLTL